MLRRWTALENASWDLIYKEDCFGLAPANPLALNVRWKFLSDDKKIDQYREWLKKQVDAGILQVKPGQKQEPWLAEHIRSSYKHGTVRSFAQARPEAMAEKLDFHAGTRQQFLTEAFDSPTGTKRIEALSTRSFEGLKGVTASMSSRLSQILSDGLAHGQNPKKLAGEIHKSIGISKQRAMTIARTEMIHAHAEGQLDAFDRLGVEEVGVMAEWSTAGDDKVCSLCGPMEGVVLKVKEARGLIPRHPNCRCAWVPADADRKEKGQKRTKAKIGKAVSASVRAEKPKAEDPHEESAWAGADLDVPQQRSFAQDVITVGAPAPSLFNKQPTEAIRWMGKEGWSFKDAKRVLADLGVDVSDATIRAQLGGWEKRGTPADFTLEQAEYLRGVRAGNVLPPKPPPKPPVDPQLTTTTTTTTPTPKPPPSRLTLPSREDIRDRDNWSKEELAELQAKLKEHEGAVRVNPKLVNAKLLKIGEDVSIEVAALADYEIQGLLTFYTRAGQQIPDGFELRMVDLEEAKPIQFGDDYINDSSRFLSKHIQSFGSSGRLGDYAPIGLDKDGRILDGNHRHAARKLAGVKRVPALVPVYVTTTLPPRPLTTAPPVDPKPIAPEFSDHAATAVVRWMGKEGFSFREAKAALDAAGLKASDATIRAQLGGWEKRGAPAELTPEQAAFLTASKGATTTTGRPVAGGTTTTPKPLIAPRPTTTPRPIITITTTTPAPRVEGKPDWLTHTGEATEFSKRVWAEIGDKGVTKWEDAVRVGRVVQEELKNRQGFNPDKERRLSALQGEADSNQAEMDRFIREWTEDRKSAPKDKAFGFADWMDRKYGEGKYKEVSERHNATAEEIRKLRERHKPKPEQVLGLLKEVRDFGGVTLDMRAAKGSEGHKKAFEAMQRGKEFLPKDWLKVIASEKSITVKGVARGYQKGDVFSHLIEVGISGGSERGTTGTAVHELMHVVENTSVRRNRRKSKTQLGHVESAYLQKRRKPGETVTAINGRSSEVGYKDEFFNHYSGRVYGRDDHFEILSMGAEGAYGLDEAVDEEQAAFTLGILVGFDL